jgi:hypothetical protein
VPTTVIDCLESVEVHVEHDMNSFLGVRRVHGLIEAAFELAAIDKTR